MLLEPDEAEHLLVEMRRRFQIVHEPLGEAVVRVARGPGRTNLRHRSLPSVWMALLQHLMYFINGRQPCMKTV